MQRRQERPKPSGISPPRVSVIMRRSPSQSTTTRVPASLGGAQERAKMPRGDGGGLLGHPRNVLFEQRSRRVQRSSGCDRRPRAPPSFAAARVVSRYIGGSCGRQPQLPTPNNHAGRARQRQPNFPSRPPGPAAASRGTHRLTTIAISWMLSQRCRSSSHALLDSSGILGPPITIGRRTPPHDIESCGPVRAG